MLMANIIDNSKITNKTKMTYKYIEKHNDLIKSAFNNVYEDLSSIFSGVEKENNIIYIDIKETGNIPNITDIVKNSIYKHIDDTCGTKNHYLSEILFAVRYLQSIGKYEIQLKK